MSKSSPRNERMRGSMVAWAWALLALLLVQNVLGIYLNLFVALPESRDLFALIASYSVLALHVTVGFLILATAGALVILGARTRRPVLWVPAAGALGFALLAFSAGVEFTIGGQEDLLSFLMELMFLGAVASDVIVLYAASRLRASLPSSGRAVRAGDE